MSKSYRSQDRRANRSASYPGSEPRRRNWTFHSVMDDLREGNSFDPNDKSPSNLKSQASYAKHASKRSNRKESLTLDESNSSASQDFESNGFKGIRVSKTKVGKGIFAERFFEEDEMVGEIDGELIDEENYGSEYCMCYGDGRVLEPSAPFRYVNHSCEPNCEFVWYEVEEEEQNRTTDRRMFLMATRTIRPGEELTIDYAWPADGAIPCKCGAETCRGWIVSSGEIDDVLEAQANLTE